MRGTDCCNEAPEVLDLRHLHAVFLQLLDFLDGQIFLPQEFLSLCYLPLKIRIVIFRFLDYTLQITFSTFKAIDCIEFCDYRPWIKTFFLYVREKVGKLAQVGNVETSLKECLFVRRVLFEGVLVNGVFRK